jgi:hypothetical protein
LLNCVYLNHIPPLLYKIVNKDVKIPTTKQVPDVQEAIHVTYFNSITVEEPPEPVSSQDDNTKTDRLEGLSELDTISECSWSYSRPPHNGPGWIARSDFGDGHDMLTYPLVIHFHPPDPLSVGVVEGLETDRVVLSDLNFSLVPRVVNRQHMSSGKQKTLPRSWMCHRFPYLPHQTWNLL